MRTGDTAIAVKVQRPLWKPLEGPHLLQTIDTPARSRLYGLVPCGVGTVWGESLTSYLNRLGWRHGVSPRALVAREMVPHLSSEHLPPQLSAFYRQAATNLNGNGSFALEWSTLLERLTGRPDLHLLTLQWWIGDLASHGHFKKVPVWCPLCYAEWKEKHLPIYQPLLWQYQVVTMCSQHKGPLDERCPHCRKTQSVITANQSPLGACTQCGAWLGTRADAQSEPMSYEEVLWQQWVIRALEELLVANLSSGPLQWEHFFTGLTICLQEHGAYSRLERLTGISRSLFYRWPGRPRTPRLSTLSHPYIPSLETILEFCYACDVTPLQVMTNQLAPLRDLIRAGTSPRPARPRRPAPDRLDRERCLELINAILDGREEPLGLRQIAKRQGCTDHTLLTHFPQECVLITKLARDHRKQRQERRLQQVRDQVRQTVITLDAQGIFPSHRRLRMMFPPGVMRMPEANAAWHAALRELGLEQ